MSAMGGKLTFHNFGERALSPSVSGRPEREQWIIMMSVFVFSLDSPNHTPITESMDLTDRTVAVLTSKFVARTLAARSLQDGCIDLTQSVTVSDKGGEVFHTLALGEAVKVRQH